MTKEDAWNRLLDQKESEILRLREKLKDQHLRLQRLIQATDQFRSDGGEMVAFGISGQTPFTPAFKRAVLKLLEAIEVIKKELK
jgi:hypothetical protein